MAMLGKVEELVALVDPGNRLARGLALLQDFLSERFPGVAGEVASLQQGETRRVTVDGDELYVLMQCYQAKQRTEGRFEAHARHTDLQYVCSGRERIVVCDLHASHPTPTYDASGNLFFPICGEDHSQLVLHPGDVAVLLPNDAHAPSLRADERESELVRKIVVKIRDAHLPTSEAAPFAQCPINAEIACPMMKL